MENKKIINIVSYAIKILVIISIVQFIFTPKSEAAISLGNIFETGDQFLEDGKNQDINIDTKDVQDEVSSIYNILLILGTALIVIIGAILGITFMVSSVEEQAKIKELLVPYVIGCVVIFGAFGIWKLVVGILAGIT